MGKEIERKFLIDQEKWSLIDKPEGEHFHQGYVVLDPEKTIRVRLTPSSAFLTIKGISIGATRSEFEYEIPQADAKELLENFAVSQLEKIRYTLTENGKTWEVDEFLGGNLGLFIAEIELSEEDEHFEKPEWLGTEVTGEEKYYNAMLTIQPFLSWS
ncbi:CYTH domain-containing protein [Pedobacter sp. MW01-1-1]|uniref:CYTH domain-containing protein n=1 Tax=Pedobacter sp. MW01-1-1 TaxID=3383027 RepID=UPI003FF09766